MIYELIKYKMAHNPRDETELCQDITDNLAKNQCLIASLGTLLLAGFFDSF